MTTLIIGLISGIFLGIILEDAFDVIHFKDKISGNGRRFNNRK